MFLLEFVILFTGGGGGCLPQCMLGCHTPPSRPPQEQPPPSPRSRHAPREQTPPGTKYIPPAGSRLRHTVNERPVRILLECILVKCVTIIKITLEHSYTNTDPTLFAISPLYWSVYLQNATMQTIRSYFKLIRSNILPLQNWITSISKMFEMKWRQERRYVPRKHHLIETAKIYSRTCNHIACRCILVVSGNHFWTKSKKCPRKYLQRGCHTPINIKFLVISPCSQCFPCCFFSQKNIYSATTKNFDIRVMLRSYIWSYIWSTFFGCHHLVIIIIPSKLQSQMKWCFVQ